MGTPTTRATDPSTRCSTSLELRCWKRASGLTLVSVIINLAHALKLNVVAEGVETEEQLSQLRRLRCDEIQGHLYGKPVPVDIFEKRYLSPIPTTMSARP